jgi:hypothetical protein
LLLCFAFPRLRFFSFAIAFIFFSEDPPMPANPNDYDYTQDDASGAGVPFDPSSYRIAGNATIDKTPEQIDADLKTSPPPGEWILRLLNFPGSEVVSRKGNLKGQPVFIECRQVTIRLCMDDNEKKYVDDKILLPPEDASQTAAYNYGVFKSSKGKDLSPGMDAAKFYKLLAGLGFAYTPGKALPDDAADLGKWIGRKTIATINPPTPWTNDQGVTREGFAQIKMFSYKPVSSGPPAGAAKVGAAAPMSLAEAVGGHGAGGGGGRGVAADTSGTDDI